MWMPARYGPDYSPADRARTRGDTAATLHARIQEQEHIAYPAAIQEVIAKIRGASRSENIFGMDKAFARDIMRAIFR